MTSTIQFNRNACPILNLQATPPSSCPASSCMHNMSGACKIRAPLDEDLDAVSEAFGTTRDDILARVDLIQKAVVADQWFEEVTRRTVVTGTNANFDEATDPKQEQNFNAWNQSNYTFAQVIAVLRFIKTLF